MSAQPSAVTGPKLRSNSFMGCVDDARLVAHRVAHRLVADANAKIGVVVFVAGRQVHVVRADRDAVRALGAPQIVGAYRGNASAAQIEDDLREWVRAA